MAPEALPFEFNPGPDANQETAVNTAVLGDVLDAIGRRHQFLPPEVQPMAADLRIAGRAMPVAIAEVEKLGGRPFGRLTDALDQLEPGEVYLARAGGMACAAWGELLTATARLRGASGAVIDGYHRDTAKILEQDWPVFSRGGYAQDAAVRASVLDYRVPVEIAGVSIQPGDLVVGDADGVVIIPQELEREVLERAQAKLRSEAEVREAIEAGASSTEVFSRFGVL